MPTVFVELPRLGYGWTASFGAKKHNPNLIAAQSVRNGSPRGSGPGTLVRRRATHSGASGSI